MARKVKLPTGMRSRNGKIQFRFTIDKKQYSVTGESIEECYALRAQKEQELKTSSYVESARLKVSEYMSRWLDNLEIAASTRRTRRKLIARMTRQQIDESGNIFGEIKLRELETEQIRLMQKALRDSGLHSRTNNETLSVLKQALSDALNERVIDWDPSKAVKPLKRTEEPARNNIHRSLSPDEVNKFLAAATGSWYYNLFIFLLYTGLRIGEASALAVGDVDSWMIRVYKTVTREDIVGYVIREQTKTDAARRKVPIRPEAWKAWNSQLQLREEFFSKKIINIKDPVFTLPKGGIIRPDRVNDDIKKICISAGIKHFTCHAFRATFTSRCVAAGMDVKHLMETLGHTDVQMTLGLYAHSEEDQRTAQILSVDF